MPLDVLQQPGSNVQLVCSHEKTIYRLMYWFQKLPLSRKLSRIGYVYYGTIEVEESLKQHFNMTVDMSDMSDILCSPIYYSIKSHKF